MKQTPKSYLGDSVYAEVCIGGEIVLTTENGGIASNTIIMEPSVVSELLLFIKRASEKSFVEILIINDPETVKALNESIKCPNPGCENGVVNTGGMTPWGSPIRDKCSWCDGRGEITKEEYEVIMKGNQNEKPTD